MSFRIAETHGMVCREARGVSHNVRVSERVARGRNVRVSERGDAATVHVLNCREYAKVKDPNLRAFMKYVQTDEAESDFTRRLREMVEAQKSIEGAKKFYLSWSLHDYDVRNEGIAIGEDRSKRETAQRMLASGKLSMEDISDMTGLPLADVEQLVK